MSFILSALNNGSVPIVIGQRTCRPAPRAPRRSRVSLPPARRMLFDLRGCYRVSNAACYRFYRSTGSPPRPGDTPFATNATLAYTSSATFGDGTWYLSVSCFDGFLDSGFLPLGPHGETYVRLDISGGVQAGSPPPDPGTWALVQGAGGVVRVTNDYAELAVGAGRGEEWAIAYTTDGRSPDANNPDIEVEIPLGLLGQLDYSLPAQADGTLLTVRLQTRRNDGTDLAPVWVYSEGSTIQQLAVSIHVPTAPVGGEAFAGDVME